MDYKQELRNKLKDLKKFEGFPLGEDESILEISQPPEYTACPNPFVMDLINQDHAYDIRRDTYNTEPFIGDISEGKNNAVYNAHSYHTKVPHKAIMQFIEHYTEEGDVVLDAFCGTGMTGVAAQLLKRKAVLSDLSPIATFIAHNYNIPIDVEGFERDAKEILNKIKKEWGYLYFTKHEENEGVNQFNTDGSNEKSKGEINFILYSDVLSCKICNGEFTFYNIAVDHQNNKIKKDFKCPHCSAELNKNKCDAVHISKFDSVLNKDITTTKQIPVLINYSAKCLVKGKWKRKRFEKAPDEYDLKNFNEIENIDIPYWFPSNKMLHKEGLVWGDTWRKGVHFGISHVHHFYTKLNLLFMAAYWEEAKKRENRNGHALLLAHSAANLTLSKMRRYRPDKKGGGPLSGTMYLSSLFTPPNVLLSIGRNVEYVRKAFVELKDITGDVRIQTQSSTNLNLPDSCIDYIFTDPPFGENLIYSELNFIWEAWLKVFTNQDSEAIISKIQNKGLIEYNNLMKESFKEYYRVLKPNRWITVEFHNSSSKVWNGIQDSLMSSGFIIAQVAVLDKKQGSFKQVMAPGSVSNDLVISAYKPDKAFERSFLKSQGLNLEADFVSQFLAKIARKPSLERTEKMLYSKMLSWYVQHGYEIRHDAKSFYSLLQSNFIEEDGFWFTSDQINSYMEYKKYAKLNNIDEIRSGGLFLFITDEKSALVWLHTFLNRPKSFSDVSVAFNQLANIQNDKVPELRNLLEENFVFEGGLYRRPKSEEENDQIVEKRQKHLWKEFETILNQAQTERKKIKEVRKEALSYGFERCYKDMRFKDILTVASKLKPSILENNGELSDFVEAAEIQVDGLA